MRPPSIDQIRLDRALPFSGTHSSEPDIEDRRFESTLDDLGSLGELRRIDSRQIAVDQPVIIADHALFLVRQAYIFEPFGMEAQLLERQVVIVLAWDLGIIRTVIAQERR